MKLSIVLSTNRPHYWPRFCDGIVQNTVPVELILVGPAGPGATAPLPVPTRFITTNANPARCWEMGSRVATGDLLCFSCDDFYYTPGYLDDVAAAAALRRVPFDMFSARYVHNHKEQIAGQMMLSDRGMPLLPVGGFAYTEDHHRLGGVDRRFHATLWDTDLYMRFFVAGGRTTLLCGHACHEIGHDSTMFVAHSPRDRQVLEGLWFRGGVATFARSSPVESYTQEDMRP